MNNIFCGLFLINIHLFFSGRLRRLSRSAGGEQGTEFKGNHKQVTFSKNCCKPRILFSGGSRRRWRTGRWTSPTTTTPTRRTRTAAFPQTWSNTRSTVKVSFELNFFPFSFRFTNCPDTGVCKWTGCDARCEDMSEFSKHITGERSVRNYCV